MNKYLRWKITAIFFSTLLVCHASEASDKNVKEAKPSFFYTYGVATDNTGNVYVTDGNNTIRKITPAGVVTTLAGVAGSEGYADGIGSAASFNRPTGIVIDKSGNIYVGDFNNGMIRKITPANVVTTLAGKKKSCVSWDDLGVAASICGPKGIAIDKTGNLFVPNSWNNTIRKITPTGTVSIFAGKARVMGHADGVGEAASFNSPASVAVDDAGNIFVADEINHTIRKITQERVVTTLAGTAEVGGYADGIGASASFRNPRGIAVDSVGNVYVADTGNSTIRKITSTGAVTTLAGTAEQHGLIDGIGDKARFYFPEGVAVDRAGNVYVADTENSTIRKITPAGMVTTLPVGPVGTDALFFGPGPYKDIIYVTGSSVNVREEPHSHSKVLTTLPIGTRVQLRGATNHPNRPDGSCGLDLRRDNSSATVNQPDWICFGGEGIAEYDLQGSPLVYAQANLFGRDQPQLETLITQHDNVPKENLTERRKWAERAAALDPYSAEAQKRLVSVLTEMGDTKSLADAEKTFDLYRAHHPSMDKESNPSIFVYNEFSIEPFAKVINGKIKPLKISPTTISEFHHSDRFFYLYSGGSRSGVVVTALELNCAAYPCPKAILTRHIESPDAKQPKLGIATPLFFSGLDVERRGVATNFLLSETNPTPNISDEQRSILAGMVKARIKSGFSKKAGKLLLQEMMSKPSWANAGKLAKDGKLFLVGNLTVGSIQGDYAQYASLLLIAEQQEDGAYKMARLPSSSSLEGCSVFDRADMDGDGIEELVLACEYKGGHGYKLLKRGKDQWEVKF